MQIGAVFPTCDIGDDPAVIRDFAQAAEELGYDYLLIYDHVLGAEHAEREPPLTGPYTERDPFHEPFVLFGYLAALTSHIELATGVLVLPQRQTALVAKQAAELALLSEGRLRLGVGSGWNWVEYQALGVDFALRGKLLEEQVELMRALWSGQVVDHRGAHHRVARANILPAPPGPIPVWFGGFTPPAVRRAARIGDGFIFGASGEPMQRQCQLLRAELEKNGRAPEQFGIESIVHYSAGPDGWHSAAERWQSLGATHFAMRTMDTGAHLAGEEPAGFTRPQEHIDALELFIEAVRDD